AEAKISRHFGTLSPGRARPREWSGTAPPVASGGLKCMTQRIVGTYCRAKMNARPIISFHAVGGLLTPPSAPTAAFDLHYGNLSPVRRLMRTAGFGVIAAPGTQYGPRKRDSGLTPAGCARRHRRTHLGAGADRLVRRDGISQAAGHDQRAVERRPTGPSDGPHRSMLVRPSPGRGRYPPDRPRISIVHPLPARGIQTVGENSPTSITKISSASAAGSYYRRINTDSTNI